MGMMTLELGSKLWQLVSGQKQLGWKRTALVAAWQALSLKTIGLKETTSGGIVRRQQDSEAHCAVDPTKERKLFFDHLLNPLLNDFFNPTGHLGSRVNAKEGKLALQAKVGTLWNHMLGVTQKQKHVSLEQPMTKFIKMVADRFHEELSDPRKGEHAVLDALQCCFVDWIRRGQNVEDLPTSLCKGGQTQAGSLTKFAIRNPTAAGLAATGSSLAEVEDGPDGTTQPGREDRSEKSSPPNKFDASSEEALEGDSVGRTALGDRPTSRETGDHREADFPSIGPATVSGDFHSKHRSGNFLEQLAGQTIGKDDWLMSDGGNFDGTSVESHFSPGFLC